MGRGGGERKKKLRALNDGDASYEEGRKKKGKK